MIAKLRPLAIQLRDWLLLRMLVAGERLLLQAAPRGPLRRRGLALVDRSYAQLHGRRCTDAALHRQEVDP